MITWVLIVLAVVLVPVSVVTVWAVNTVTNTDHYVATLAPLARERVVTDYIALDATDQLFEKVHVQEKITNALPKKADFLAAPLTGTLQNFVQRQLTDLLRSPWFHNLWDTLNRRSHTAVINILSGKTVPGQRANRVLVNLTPVLTKAIDQFDQRGVTLFDPLRAQLAHAQTVTFELASSQQISKARNFFTAASDLGWAAPLLAVIAIVLALVVAVDRRKTLLRVAVGTALLTLVLLGALALGRSFFLSHAAARVPPTVTGTIFDTVIRFLRSGLKWVLLIAVIVAALLWLVGPARWPRWLRAQGARGIRWTGRRAAELGNEQNRQRATAGARKGAGMVPRARVRCPPPRRRRRRDRARLRWQPLRQRRLVDARRPGDLPRRPRRPVRLGPTDRRPRRSTLLRRTAEPVTVGVPAATGEPPGEEGDRHPEHPGDDDHDDQRRLR